MDNKFIVLLMLLIAFSCKNEIQNKVDNYSLNFIANVIGVKDGDTIKILYNQAPIVIRLGHIDCPEKKNHLETKLNSIDPTLFLNKMLVLYHKGKKIDGAD
jgi:micrococcal nuclease